MTIVWIIAFVVFLTVEAFSAALTSIWFAGGALAALVAQMCSGSLEIQLLVFVVTSFLLFLMVRPFAYKYLYREKAGANVDNLTGRRAVIKTRVDDERGTGSAVLSGETWLARAAKEGEVFEPGTSVVVTGVSGAKLLVEAVALEEEKE